VPSRRERKGKKRRGEREKMDLEMMTFYSLFETGAQRGGEEREGGGKGGGNAANPSFFFSGNGRGERRKSGASDARLFEGGKWH